MAIARKPKTHARQPPKVSAHHHRKTKAYKKLYWPYLTMFLMVCLGLVINSSLTHRGTILGATTDLSAQGLLLRTNSDRVLHHEAPLTLNTQLMTAADQKAQDMVKRNYWSHYSPDGKSPWSFITSNGYNYQVAGENLAYGFTNSADIESSWMQSAEHRANILDTNYQNVGYGIVHAPNFMKKGSQYVIVALYAAPSKAAATITFNVANHVVPAPISPSTTRAIGKSQLVSRVQLYTGTQTWSLALLSLVTGLAIAFFLLRHGLRIHRLLRRGESMMMHHPFLDIAVVAIITIGVLLTRTSGIIH